MSVISMVVILTVALPVLLIIAGQMGLLRGKPPERLGITDGKLKAPSRTPNSVSSQASMYPDHLQRDYADIGPFKFSGDGVAAMAKIADVLQKMVRTTLIKQEPDYLYAQCSTPLLRFTDDIEFWLDSHNGVIQVRSSSRLGQKDFNVNRQRVEAIRSQASIV